MSRTPNDLEQIISTATQRDLLNLRKATGCTGDEIDEYTHILVAYLIDKTENGSSSIDKWLDKPLTEVAEYLDVDEDSVEDPKEPETESTETTGTSQSKPDSV